jgi:hypothetical protein
MVNNHAFDAAAYLEAAKDWFRRSSNVAKGVET